MKYLIKSKNSVPKNLAFILGFILLFMFAGVTESFAAKSVLSKNTSASIINIKNSLSSKTAVSSTKQNISNTFDSQIIESASDPIDYWAILGNSATVDGTNFVGTTDNVPLNFRVNNITAGRIDNSLNNAFYGFKAGLNNTTGAFNVALGSEALISNTAGSRNIAIGYQTLHNNSHALGSNNIALGYQALYSNVSAMNNIALGYQALRSNTTAVDNTAFGYKSLFANTTGSGNVGFGYETLLNNITGSNNLASGYHSLYSNVSGHSNIALGFQALDTNTSGNFNIALGENADVSANNLTNATAIGYNAVVGASNSMVLGGIGSSAVNVGIGTTTPSYRLSVISPTTGIVASITNSDGTCTLDPGDGSWTCPSDENLKKDIDNLEAGLNEINELRPVTYRFKNEADSEELSMGLIAQEVEPVFPKLVKTQLDGTLALNYGGLTPVMIKAIQELDLKIDSVAIPESQNLFSRLIAWFGDVGNGIGDLFVKKLRTKEICISDETGETCITKAQLDKLLSGSESTPVEILPVVSSNKTDFIELDSSEISKTSDQNI